MRFAVGRNIVNEIRLQYRNGTRKDRQRKEFRNRETYEKNA